MQGWLPIQLQRTLSSTAQLQKIIIVVVKSTKEESTMSLTMHGFSKTTPQIYRDCLRLVKHISGKSKKSVAITRIVRNEFKKNAHLKDDEVIEKLKSNAIRGLSNYLMMESSAKDPRFQQQSKEFIKREVESIKDTKS